PAADDEAGDGGADHHLALVPAQLRAPVGGLDDLAAQVVDRGAELDAVGLDRAADLLRRARRAHVDLSIVCLISWASSIAICGVRGVLLRNSPAAVNPAITASRISTPNTIR